MKNNNTKIEVVTNRLKELYEKFLLLSRMEQLQLLEALLKFGFEFKDATLRQVVIEFHEFLTENINEASME